MNKNRIYAKAAFGFLVAAFFAVTFAIYPKQAQAQEGTWERDDCGLRYQKSDGSFVSNQWALIDGARYFFNGEGYAHCGDYAWIENKWYAFNWDCTVCEGWFWDSDEQAYYYADPTSGYLHTNCWSWIDGNWYGFESNCQMSKGWTLGAYNTWFYCAPYTGPQTDSGYCYPGGSMYWNDWAWIDGAWYYFWGNGAMTGEAELKILNASEAEPYAGYGYCAFWVSNVYQRAGYGEVKGNACDQYYRWCRSSNINDLKPGMIIAVPKWGGSELGQIYGHVGVYIGYGRVRHNSSDSIISECSLDEWLDKYGDLTTPKWGYATNSAI